VVYRKVEEALDLAGVQVAGHQAVGAGGRHQVGDQLGGDAHPRLVFAVLAGVAEVGHHRGYVLGRGPAGGVDHQEQFHQVFGRRAGRLHDEHFAPPDRLVEARRQFPVAEPLRGDGSQWLAVVVRYFLSQVPALGSRKHFNRIGGHRWRK
jgi:hypothetical protein